MLRADGNRTKEGEEAKDSKSDVKNSGDNIEKLSATPEELIKEYWRIVEKCEDKVAVEYGNDLDVIEYGSGFPVRKDLKEMRESYEDPNSSHRQTQFKRNVPLKDGGDPDYYESCGWNLNNLPHHWFLVAKHSWKLQRHKCALAVHGDAFLYVCVAQRGQLPLFDKLPSLRRTKGLVRCSWGRSIQVRGVHRENESSACP